MGFQDAVWLDKVAVLSPWSVLRLLAEAPGGGTGAQDRPLVRVCLAGGHAIEGRVVCMGAERQQEVVVLACQADHSTTGQLAYLLLEQVTAVTVDDPATYRDLLTRGALPAAVAGDPPSLLSLRRDFAPSPELPLEIPWDSLPAVTDARANLARLLAGVRETAERVRADAAGRQAWAAIGTIRVAHREGAALSVARVPDGLAVTADLTAALPRRLADDLGHQVNALL